MNNKQTKRLEDALSHIQEARALLTEYYADEATPITDDMVRRLNGLVNGVHIEIHAERQ